ncbi:hypothetical protein, partial [Palaeococcus ferrophilus]|uniref:hypothetical protein n=1 Tax=Palaeococcus ferrophilus TaxID=83868 RepID=UPI000A05C563
MRIASLGLVLLFLMSFGAVPLFNGNYVAAQEAPAPWVKTYGESDLDVAQAVAIAPNGDLIILGYTHSPGTSTWDYDFLVLRLDENGSVKWQRTYGGSNYDEARAVAIAPNGDIIVVGYTYSFDVGNGDVWVLRLDENGNIKWQKTYGEFPIDRGYAVAIASNGDIIVAGYAPGASGDVWVLRLDENGSVKWQKTYGGSDVDGAYTVAIADNGDIIVAGYYGATDSYGSGGDVWVLRLDENGNVKWQKTYGGSNDDVARAVAIASNGDIIVVGYTYSFGAGNDDVWVLRLDENGNIKWQKAYGGNGGEKAYAVTLADNGDVIVTGYTYSFGAGNNDVWVLGLDENGNVKWQKTYGGRSVDSAYSVAMTSTMDIIVAGYTQSFGAGNNDVWILRLPPDGYLPPEGKRDLNFYTGDSNAVITETSVTAIDSSATWTDTSVLGKTSDAIIQDTDVTTKTQYYYTGPTELSLTPPTPENGSVMNTDYVFVNMTSNNILVSALLEWDGQNLTMQKASDTNWYLNVTGLVNGQYSLRVWGKDLSEKWVTS